MKTMLSIVAFICVAMYGMRKKDLPTEFTSRPVDQSVYVYQPFPGNCEWYSDISNADTDAHSGQIIRNSVLKHPTAHEGNLATEGEWPVNFINNAPVSDNIYFHHGYNCTGDYPAKIPSLKGHTVQNGEYLSDASADCESCAKDHHLILCDSGSRKLYEFYQPRPLGRNGEWLCTGGAAWDLTKCSQRAEGTTSADAAGLPLLPFLITSQEMKRGEIRHALRMTLTFTAASYVKPATHGTHFWRPDTGYYMPMGARVRLRSNFDTIPFNPNIRIILRCLMKYGAYIADNGTNFAITYVRDDAMREYGENEWHSINLVTEIRDPRSGISKELHVTAYDLEVLKIGPHLRNQRLCN